MCNEPELFSEPATTGPINVLLLNVSVASVSESVPVPSGKVIVLSAVGSVTEIVVSNPSAVSPSSSIGLAPGSVPRALAWIPVNAEPSPEKALAITLSDTVTLPSAIVSAS